MSVFGYLEMPDTLGMGAEGQAVGGPLARDGTVMPDLMSRHNRWLDKFPQFIAVSYEKYYELEVEASAEMGYDPSRWLGIETYLIARGYLIAHLAAMAETWETGDHSTLQPYREKEVDDVRVEYAVSRDMQNNLDPYLATSYGQQYIKWRRMAFAGPRVV